MNWRKILFGAEVAIVGALILWGIVGLVRTGLSYLAGI